jgi:hypothetical protein
MHDCVLVCGCNWRLLIAVLIVIRLLSDLRHVRAPVKRVRLEYETLAETNVSTD